MNELIISLSKNLSAEELRLLCKLLNQAPSNVNLDTDDKILARGLSISFSFANKLAHKRLNKGAEVVSQDCPPNCTCHLCVGIGDLAVFE